jgi:preprotein translocase subunit SecD
MKWSKVGVLAIVIVLVALAVVLSVAPGLANHMYTKNYLPLSKWINLGLDLRGGVHVVIQAEDTEEAKVTPEAMKQLRAVLENRVNQFGVSEPIIQQQGERRMIVELAGIKDPEEAVNTMIKTAFLEFKDPEGNTVVTGKDLQDAQESRNQGGGIVVNLTFKPEGTQKFAEATTKFVHQPISIILDGKVLQTPTVSEPITGGKAEITGYSTLEDARNIAILLRSGALPLKATVIEKRTVGPALGSDSLAKSMHAGVVGVTAILVFMLMYYRLPGLVANLALIIYTLIVLWIYAGFHVVMTLPSIAGFLLTLGIAVDTNVIIFERIKEELRSGKSLRAAIDAGFKRGFTAVFDANATTLLAAAVLMFFGTGAIKGFAVTLIIGVTASMFTAISVTRWLLHLVASTNAVKNAKYFGA